MGVQQIWSRWGGLRGHSSRWPQRLVGKGREESFMILAPGWCRTAPLFLCSGQADMEVVIRQGRSVTPGLCHQPYFTGGETEAD